MYKIKKQKLLFTTLPFLLVFSVYAGDSSQLKLWYKQPAIKWDEEALPIGNGRMGAMLFGGIKTERIQFNEQSLCGSAIKTKTKVIVNGETKMISSSKL